MDKCKFSVLLSVYYKESPLFLKESLNSVFNQTLCSDDVVLVEDGRLGEQLEQIICDMEIEHPELHVVRFDKNRGLGYALNDGLKYCKHDIIVRMDTDDIAMPNRFEEQIKVMYEHPEYGIVSSWITEFQKTPGDSSLVRKLPENPKDNYNYAKTRCPVNHFTAVFRKNEVLDAGGYQTSLFPEDYFLWIKMLQNGTKIYNIQKSLLWFRCSPSTIKRRGGWKYACDEAITQLNVYKLGFIGIPTMCKNITLRFTTRLLPNSIRVIVYKLIRRYF